MYTCPKWSSSHTSPYQVVQVPIQILPSPERSTKETQTEVLRRITKKTRWAKCLKNKPVWIWRTLKSCRAKRLRSWPRVMSHEHLISRDTTAITQEQVGPAWPRWAFLLTAFYKKWKYAQTKEVIHKEQWVTPCTNKFQSEILHIENKKLVQSRYACYTVPLSSLFFFFWFSVSYFPISNNVSLLHFDRQKNPHKQMGELTNTVSLGHIMKVLWLIIQKSASHC